MRARIGLTSLVAIACASCISIGEMLAPTYDMVVVNHRPDPIYEDFAPRYVELCAVSQYRPRNGRLGGIPGHAVMYLKGACLDEDRDYPDMMGDARFVELEPNLRYYRERYGTILENRDDSLGWWSRRDDDYLAARERYYAYVEKRLADVDVVLDALEARDDEY